MSKLPTVSLLVAMRNEANYIEACIASLLNQDYPADCLDVLILDGQSTDNSWTIVEALIAGKPNFRLVTNEKRIQSAAWNLGIRICQGEVISIVSGHSELAPDYVSKAVETLQRTGADMVGGVVRSSSLTFVGEAIAVAISTPFGVGGARFRYTNKEEETDTVFMGFCQRRVYEDLGGFDEELVRNQDDEFSYRLRKAGGKIICNPQIVSSYFSRVTLSGLWQQYFQYGYWKIRVMQKHPLQMQMRHFIPFILVTSIAILTLLSALNPIFAWLLLGLLVCYLMAGFASALLVAAKTRWLYFPMLPIIFIVLHFSYGLGFAIGLPKFWKRWRG